MELDDDILLCYADCESVLANGCLPLTPGTNQKMSQAVQDTFRTFEKEQKRLSIPNGNFYASVSMPEKFLKFSSIDHFPIKFFSNRIV